MSHQLDGEHRPLVQPALLKAYIAEPFQINRVEQQE